MDQNNSKQVVALEGYIAHLKAGGHPKEYNFGSVPFEEAQLAQHAACAPGYSRTLSPEALLGDHVAGAPLWGYDRSRAVHPILSHAGSVWLRNADYNVIGVVGQAQAALDAVYTLGRNDQTDYPFVFDGGTGLWVAGDVLVPGGMAFSAPNLVLGVAIDWGVQLQQFTPFIMTIETRGFAQTPWAGGANYLDRRVAVYVDGKTSNGSTLLIPFAHRLGGNGGSATATSPWTGGASPTPATAGGMSMAMMQPAYLGFQTTVENVDPPLPGIGPLPTPTVRIGPLPASVIANFGATMQLLTAGAPITALYADLEGLLTAEPSPAAMLSHRGRTV